MQDVIFQISVNPSLEMLARLLPERWAQEHPQQVFNHRLDESLQKAQRGDQRRARLK